MQQPPAQIGFRGAAELGQPVEREMQLRRQPARAQMLDATDESGIELRGAEQLQKGRLRIGARDHGGARRYARPIRARRPPRDLPRPGCASPACASGSPRRAPSPNCASASQSAPTPPTGCDSPPPAAACAASRYSSVNTVPGERGPKFVPSTASKPRAPLSNGVSKCSSSRSYTFMPPMRSSSRMSSRPESANLPAESCQRGVILPVGSAEPRRYPGKHRHQRLGEALHLRAYRP